MTRNICIFSDGTGQRGVRVDDGATNIFKLYEWARDVPDQVCFYDPGVGSEPGKGLDWTTWARNLVDKSTGLGITRNIHDCYDFLVRSWREDSRVAVFGFSRGAYTVRSLASAVMLCGVPDRLQDGLDITGDEPPAKALRSRLLSEAIGIYQSHYGPRGAEERKAKARHYRERYRCHDAPVHLVAVFDTVAALGLPGIANLANPLRHRFHDAKLSGRVRFGFQALAIDENRKVFAPVPWDETEKHPEQTIEQVWFPGVHSDIGGGYENRALSDFALSWMMERCSAPEVGLRFEPASYRFKASVNGEHHDERTGWGRFWTPGDRSNFILKLSADSDRLCDRIEDRFQDPALSYRPKPLQDHPRTRHYYP
ncbi:MULTISPECIES: DUF2235 domain-containing protein [Hyphomicrobiales]|jgi:uncharacterized protein (DUF2235 family)|uniref:DUF2235 domain-containing protein n=1 Tax=Bosea massiliensis TaxID=151419 RepID=A0ABW0PA36_9HYPH|nr:MULTISPECIES: DUF2235 domain-containing protein [Hyphomicrobiales]